MTTLWQFQRANAKGNQSNLTGAHLAVNVPERPLNGSAGTIFSAMASNEKRPYCGLHGNRRLQWPPDKDICLWHIHSPYPVRIGTVEGVLASVLATAPARGPLGCQTLFLSLGPEEAAVFKFAQNPRMLDRCSESVYQALRVLALARCDIGHANLQSLPDNLLQLIYHRLNSQSTSP